jgi:DNA-directed RNA polymerase specialized sigma24 family protein
MPLTMRDRSRIMDDMKTLTKKQRVAVIRCPVEGCSIRSTVRITGVAKNTIQRLTREMGGSRKSLALGLHLCDGYAALQPL